MLASAEVSSASFSFDDHTAKIIKRTNLEKIARTLEERGLYDEALKKYREAMDPILLNYDYEAGVAMGGVERIYQKQGNYELALKELQWHLQRNPKKYEDNKLELESLIKARNSHTNKPVVEFINHMKRKNEKFLPPKKYLAGTTETISSDIIRSYDHIGDQDGGIAFVDEILRYWEKKSGQDLHRLGNKNQYFLIRQAFEQDKKEGFKGCLEAKPGEACMGRATKALIQSDYFPW